MASITDKITDIRNAARPNSARVSSSRSSGATTLACDNLAGWPTVSKVHFVTYQIDSNSNPIAGTQLDCAGIVSGSNIGTFTVIDGTDNGNLVGDVVEMLPTAAWGQDLADALMTEHGRTGLHDSTKVAMLAGTQTFTGIKTFTTMPVAPNSYKFSVYRDAAFNITNAFAKVNFDTKNFDTGSNFDATTNFRFTAPVAGFYQFNWVVGAPISGTTDNVAAIYKNGSVFAWGDEGNAGGSSGSLPMSLALNDYVEIFVVGTATVAANVGNAPQRTYFSGYLVSTT